MGFSRYGLENFLPGLASNGNPPDLCVLGSWDYRYEPLAPGWVLKKNFFFGRNGV
jgi:hypothetical protein